MLVLVYRHSRRTVSVCLERNLKPGNPQVFVCFCLPEWWRARREVHLPTRVQLLVSATCRNENDCANQSTIRSQFCYNTGLSWFRIFLYYCCRPRQNCCRRSSVMPIYALYNHDVFHLHHLRPDFTENQIVKEFFTYVFTLATEREVLMNLSNLIHSVSLLFFVPRPGGRFSFI